VSIAEKVGVSTGFPTPAPPHAHAPHEGASKTGPSLHPPLRIEPPSDPGWFTHPPATANRRQALSLASILLTDPPRQPARSGRPGEPAPLFPARRSGHPDWPSLRDHPTDHARTGRRGPPRPRRRLTGPAQPPDQLHPRRPTSHRRPRAAARRQRQHHRQPRPRPPPLQLHTPGISSYHSSIKPVTHG
jgi:hypothetical protein